MSLLPIHYIRNGSNKKTRNIRCVDGLSKRRQTTVWPTFLLMVHIHGYGTLHISWSNHGPRAGKYLGKFTLEGQGEIHNRNYRNHEYTIEGKSFIGTKILKIIQGRPGNAAPCRL